MDLTIRAGAMARLECAALGHPAPQIAWHQPEMEPTPLEVEAQSLNQGSPSNFVLFENFPPRSLA